MQGYEAKIDDLFARGDLHCTCWECLRAVGVTPTVANAERHRDVSGRIHDARTGEIDHPLTAQRRASRSEAEAVMKKGRGQDV